MGEKILKVSCGVDIIEVSRIQECIENMQEKFLHKIYTPLEIEYCKSKNKMMYQHFAARFAAKEAIFKAISNTLENKYEIAWTDVEILNDENGRPYVHFINEKYFIEQIDVSISHLKEYAIANCVIVIN